MTIKEIINNHYRDGFNGNISYEELSSFIHEYMIVNELKEEYKRGISNRKELGSEIIERTKDIKNIMKLFEMHLVNNNYQYVYPEYITDYGKAFELLIHLSNVGDKKYTFRVYKSEQFKKPFKKSEGNNQGEIWVIGEENIIDNIKVAKAYNSDFGVLAANLINENNSLVIMADNCEGVNVLPDEYKLKSDFKKFKVRPLIGEEICCYTFDDELGAAVKKLDNYVQTYGGDFDNIPSDIIIDRINDLEKNKEKDKKFILK